MIDIKINIYINYSVLGDGTRCCYLSDRME